MAHVAPAALDQREDALRHAAGLDGGGDRLGDDLAGAGMGRVALDHDGAAGGERRGGVAARGREGERKVRGAEHRDRADRPLDHAQIGARQRLALGQGFVVAAVEIVALLDVVGEQAQLPGGAGALTLKAPLGQAGLGGADLGDLIASRLDLARDGAQEGGPLGAAGIAVGCEGVLGGACGAVDELRRADAELVRRPARGFGAEGRVARNPLARDQVLSVRRECRLVEHGGPPTRMAGPEALSQVPQMRASGQRPPCPPTRTPQGPAKPPCPEKRAAPADGSRPPGCMVEMGSPWRGTALHTEPRQRQTRLDPPTRVLAAIFELNVALKVGLDRAALWVSWLRISACRLRPLGVTGRTS